MKKKIDKQPEKHWYEQCANVIESYWELKSRNRNEAYKAVNGICSILEDHGFIDSDWWAENEKIK